MFTNQFFLVAIMPRGIRIPLTGVATADGELQKEQKRILYALSQKGRGVKRSKRRSRAKKRVKKHKQTTKTKKKDEKKTAKRRCFHFSSERRSKTRLRPWKRQKLHAHGKSRCNESNGQFSS